MRPGKQKPAAKSRLSGRRGASSSVTGGIAFDFGDGGGGGTYSKTTGILSSAGRLGAAVVLGALALMAVLLRRDAADVALLAGSGVAAGETAAAAGGGEGGGGGDSPASAAGAGGARTSFRGGGAAAGTGPSAADYITLKTPHGSIRIALRPDLSAESVAYVRRVVNTKSCSEDSCRLYRAEEPGILQGVLKSGADVQPPLAPNRVFGTCPDEYKSDEQDCPPHDPGCGCHGPVMVHGMVGWAAGTSGGPDFFIDTYEKPAKHWGNQHTVWGFVDDQSSLDTIKRYWDLPVKMVGGMHMLVDEVPFTPVAAGGRMARWLDSLWSLF